MTMPEEALKVSNHTARIIAQIAVVIAILALVIGALGGCTPAVDPPTTVTTTTTAASTAPTTAASSASKPTPSTPPAVAPSPAGSSSPTTEATPDNQATKVAPPAKADSPVPTLKSTGASCPWAVIGDNSPAMQDGGNGLQPLMNVNSAPSASAMKCAVARAEAAGYFFMPDSAFASVVHPNKISHQAYNGSNPQAFTSVFVSVVPQGSNQAACIAALVVYDYQGNFFPVNVTDPLSSLNMAAKTLVKLHPNDYTGCVSN